MSTTAPEDIRARVTLVLGAAPSASGDALEDAVRRVGAVLLERVGADGAVRLGVRDADDPLGAAMGERRTLEPVDAVIEATTADGVEPEEAAALVEGVAGVLGDAVDVERSVVIAGSAHRFLSGEGNLFIALAGRRDPAISRDDLFAWWLRHGPFALGLVDPLPQAYEQLHADPAVSAIAGAAAGLPAGDHDMYDTIAIESVADLEGSVMRPDVAAALLEDEVGNVDHSSLRGALQRVIRLR